VQYQFLYENARRGHKQLAVLIDPERSKLDRLDELLSAIHEYKVEIIFLGGSFLMEDELEACMKQIKSKCPATRIFLFPGSSFQINEDADALLFLSVLSGRNAEYLIGKHVIAAPYIKSAGLEAIGTAYILVDGGKSTAAHYMSGSQPVPHDQNQIASATALAGEMLGLQMIYLDAGSGARNAVSQKMIHDVKKEIDIPLIVGGGIRTKEQAFQTAEAGADIIVVGNAFENDPSLIPEFQMIVREIEAQNPADQ
jgi:putative glycerol-1-phosphate prenyltransferase